MNINQLAYFRAVCEAGSISAAAERLYIARPSLSASMGALEREVGAKLLERRKSGVSPTEAGAALLECAIECDGLLSACLRRIGGMGALGERRTLLLGCSGGTMDPDAIDRIYAYEQACEEIAVELVDNEFPDCWRAVEEGAVDLAITVRPPARACVESVRIGRLEQSLVANASSAVAMRGARRGWVDFTCDLAGCTLLETEGRLTDYLDLLDSLGIRRTMVGGDSGFIRQLIARDRGCVLTISSLLDRYTCDEAAVLPVRGIPAEMDLDPYLVLHPKADEATRAFANHVLGCLGSQARV